ncbi:MAG TPA: radical SAM protein [Chitinispirillaceae bacterium]|nr:radical SAM protein [Chitinispirillaceae bacterium]
MKILFLQLPVPTLVPQKSVGNHLLAASSLFLHARFHNAVSGHDIEVLPQEVCTRAGDSYVIDAISAKSPDIVAFTCTVWNSERTLFIADAIKKRKPGIKVWLGGPEIASDAYFVNCKDQPFDLAVEGEGEEIFRLLLEGVDPSTIDRVHIPFGKKNITAFPAPVISLCSIHEPFINGFAQMESDGVILSELFRGCRYGCLFCRYTVSGTKKNFALRPYDQVSEVFKWARKNCARELFLLDPSFEQRPDLHEFLKYLSEINSHPQIPIFAELRAESVTKELAELLIRAGIHHVEAGLQTVTSAALKNVKRTFNSKLFSSGVRNLQAAGIKIRPDIMIGLPGDTPEGLRDTLDFVKKLDLAADAQVFKTQVLPGTALRKQAEKFNIEYELRPPYQVLSTPQWKEDEMYESLFDVEEILDTRCTPEESPVLLCSGSVTKEVARFAGTDIEYAYFFDCTSAQGRERFLNETFSRTSVTVSLVCKLSDFSQLDVVKNKLLSFYQMNPFSTSIVGFEIPAGFPLDLFDIVNTLKLQNNYSSYLQSLYPTAFSQTPHRRTIACLKITECSHCTNDWLCELREVAEVVWIVPVSQALDGTLLKIKFVENVDFVYIDGGENYATCQQLQLLSQTAFKHQVIFPDIDTLWQFLEMRNRSDS